MGFCLSLGLAVLAWLGPPVVADVGSGALLPFGDEPLVGDAVGDGAALTVFSGDKLLGGPQAGIAVGDPHWIGAMRRHPLARALRADKLCLAALEATLTSYLEGTATEDLPTLKMLRASEEEVRKTAEELAEKLSGEVPGVEADVAPSVARSGGGTLPLYEIPSSAVRLGGPEPEVLAEGLRAADPPVVGRVHEGRVWLDARTLLPGDDGVIVAAVKGAVG
jgi:L-seryl-tRNA(Ser) seleniumtransferase